MDIFHHNYHNEVRNVSQRYQKMTLAHLPSGNQTWLENPLWMEVLIGKSPIDIISVPCSSTPCLITRGNTIYIHFPLLHSGQHGIACCLCWDCSALSHHSRQRSETSLEHGWSPQNVQRWFKDIWGFPEIGVPPNHHFNGIFHHKPSIWGYNMYGNPHMWWAISLNICGGYHPNEYSKT